MKIENMLSVFVMLIVQDVRSQEMNLLPPEGPRMYQTDPILDAHREQNTFPDFSPEQHFLQRPHQFEHPSPGMNVEPKPGVFAQEHHFLTRPQSFVTNEHGIIRLPHLIASAPAGLQLPSSGARLPQAHFVSPSGLNIIAENVVIEPKITHISMLPFNRLLERPLSPQKHPIALPPRRPLLHNLFPSLNAIMISNTLTDSKYPTNRLPSQSKPDFETTIDTDNVKPQSLIESSPASTILTESANHFRPLLSPGAVDTGYFNKD